MKFLYCCSTYRVPVMNIVWKYDSRQMIRFVYLPSISSRLCWIGTPNMNRAKWLNKCTRIGVSHAAHLCWIWVPGMTWTNPNNRVLALVLHRIGAEYWLETLLPPLEKNPCIGAWHADYLWWILARNMTRAKWEIRLLAFDIQPICAEYGVETGITQRDEISVLGLDKQCICTEYGLKTWLAPTKEIRVLAIDLQPICAE
jgi:hypothetical protein